MIFGLLVPKLIVTRRRSGRFAGPEERMQSAERACDRCAAPSPSDRRVAGDRPGEHPRIGERRVEADRAGAEIDLAEESDIEGDERRVAGRRCVVEPAENQKTVKLSDLHYDAELPFD